MGHADLKFRATQIVRQMLIGNTQLAAMIGSRVFPIVAPIETEGDFIIYKRDTYKKDRSQMGIASQSVGVFVTAISEDYDRSVDMIVLVNDILEGEHDGLKIELEDANEGFEDGKYIQEILFTIN